MAVDDGLVGGAAAAGGGDVAAVAGEIVSWSMHGKTTIGRVREGLIAAGWDPAAAKKLAPDMRPVDAMARVCNRELVANGRLSQKLDSTADYWLYQFNGRTRADAPGEGEGDVRRVEFPFQAILRLGKKTGLVSATVPAYDDLARHFNELLVAEMDIRSAGDVTVVVQRAFEKKSREDVAGDLFRVRDAGGVYLAMPPLLPFVDRVDRFVTHAGGKFHRFGVAASERASVSIAETVEAGLRSLLREYRLAIAQLKDSSRKSTVDDAIARVAELREKIQYHEAYLHVTYNSVRDDFNAANGELRAAIELCAGGDPAAVTTEPLAVAA